MVATDVAERGDYAFLHALQSAHVDIRLLIGQQLRHLVGARADHVLHVPLRLSRHAREREVDVDEILRQFHQRAEVRQFLGHACAEEQQQFTTLFQLAATAAVLGHRAHRRGACAGADHHQRRTRMIRHQERRAIRADHLHLIALLQIAQEVRANAGDLLALVVFGDALHRQRQVVVVRPLAVARARDRIEPYVMRLAARIQARWDHAHRLAFEHRKRLVAEVEHDVADVARCAVTGQPQVPADRGDDRVCNAVQVDVRMRSRPRW